ncbi:glutathione S-transferase [Kordiimonas sediminis]|uniref:Glutathione S-transferase n=1 Tax=Kordiimonas sediminis TaxID=1735581 RepID=A0A919E5Z8_9PROT|nr:glutathione S-transferase family protein [Kordiimonas sediminis]GHF17423.1 glutathione S-transferase [Kordiimonas sediminis]
MSERKLYSFPLSGNAHRVALFLSFLGLDYDLVQVDLKAGEQKTDAFLQMNPNGKVPVYEDGDDTLYESTAILMYLALKYGADTWLPSDPYGRAVVQKYLNLAGTAVANGPAAARLAKLFGAPVDLDQAYSITADLFSKLETVLGKTAFLESDTPTVADVAIYTYVAHAPEGGFDPSPYPAVIAWINRIEALPGFVPMIKSPIAKVA